MGLRTYVTGGGGISAFALSHCCELHRLYAQLVILPVPSNSEPHSQHVKNKINHFLAIFSVYNTPGSVLGAREQVGDS